MQPKPAEAVLWQRVEKQTLKETKQNGPEGSSELVDIAKQSLTTWIDVVQEPSDDTISH